MLMVGTGDGQFCDVVTDLVIVGRAPELKDGSVVGATCHEFETAGLEAADQTRSGAFSVRAALEGTVEGSEDALDDADVAFWETSHAAGAEIHEDTYDEMESLLADEMEAEALAIRAHRTSIRRLARPGGAVQQGRQRDSCVVARAPPPEPPSTQTAPSPSSPPDVVAKRRRLSGSGGSSRWSTSRLSGFDSPLSSASLDKAHCTVSWQ